MNQLQDMLTGLSSEGALEARSEFQLDSAKAREKLQKFQLEDPHFYVLELVQAAHLLGATEIRFEIDADEMELHFDGELLTRDELEQLYSAAFAKLTDTRKQAMRHIAIAFNAAQALEPSRLILQVASDKGSITLTSTPDAERDDITESDEPPGFKGTRIYLRESFRASHLMDFFRNLDGNLAEKTALRERCATARLPIFLDGKRISRGPDAIVGGRGLHRFETDMEHGLLAFREEQSESQLSILQNGVLMTQIRPPSGLVSTVAVVDSQRLNKNISQSAFVEDKQWDYLLGQVLRLQLHVALSLDFENRVITSDGVFEEDAPLWVHDLFEPLGKEIKLYRDASRALPPQTERLVALLERWQVVRVAHNLDDRVPTSRDNNISILQLRELLKGRRTLTYSTKGFNDLDVSELSPVILGSESRLAWLRQWMGMPLKDVGEQLEVMNRRRINKARWESQPLRSEPLLATRYRVRVPFDCGDGVEGVWAIDFNEWCNARISSNHSEGRISFIKDRRLLSRRSLQGFLFKGVNLVFHGDIEENELFDDPREDKKMFERYLTALDHFPELMSLLADQFIERERDLGGRGMSYFLNQINTQIAGNLAEQVLFAMNAPTREFPQSILQWRMQREREDGFWSLSQTKPADREKRIATLGKLADIPFFEDMSGGAASLRELSDEVGSRGKFGVYDGTPSPAFERDWKDAELDQRVFLIGRGLASSVLSQMIGARYYRYMGQVVRRHATANRFLQRPEVALELPEGRSFAVESAYAFEKSEGVVGLLRGSDVHGVWSGKGWTQARPTISVKVLYKRRALQEIELDVAMGMFQATIDVLGANPNSSWDGILEDSYWLRLRKDLYEHVAGVFHKRCTSLIERLEELSSHDLFELWMYLKQAEIDRYSGGREQFQKVRHMLRDAAVFRVHGGDAINLASLERFVKQSRVLHVVKMGGEVLTALLPANESERGPVVMIPDHISLKEIEHWFQTVLEKNLLRLVDVTDSNEAQEAIEKARAKFMSREELTLEVPARPGSVIASRSLLTEDGVRGELGMLLDVNAEDSYPGVKIEVLVHGRRATTTSMSLCMGRFAARIEVERVQMKQNYEGVVEDEAYSEALLDVQYAAHELMAEHLKQRIDEGYIVSAMEIGMFEHYVVRAEKIKFAGSHIARQIVSLFKELPIFELLDCPRARELATGPADVAPYVSLSELSSLIGECYVWVDSKMERSRIPEDMNAPVVIFRDMNHRRKLGPVIDKLYVADLAEHIRALEDKQRREKARQRALEAIKEREEKRKADEVARKSAESEKKSVIVDRAKASQEVSEDEAARREAESAQTSSPASSRFPDEQKKSVIVDWATASQEEDKEREQEPAPISIPAPRKVIVEPELLAEPEVQPEPEPEPDPVELLLEDVVAQLREVRGSRSDLLGDPILSRLVASDRVPGDLVAQVKKSDVEVAREHEAIRYALDNPEDPVALAFLSSSVYSAINLYYERITDADEQTFQERMLGILLASSV